MSYLAQYAQRRPESLGRRFTRRRGARVDERLKLNLPGFHGDAYVRVFVEDTTGRRRAQEPRVRLRIADCENEISLWFELEDAAHRTNSLHKIDTLLGALTRFREALRAEADLQDTRSSRKEDRSCRT